jgi:polygalacturonase
MPSKLLLLLLLQLLLLAPLPCSSQRSLNLLDYGGRGDGRSDNTAAFARAVAAVAALGGGTLIVPAGTFVTRAFNLTSFMTLFLEDGAAIQASLDFPAWPLIAPLPTYPGDGLRYSPLIGGYGLQQVRILGNASARTGARIDGSGLAWNLANAAKLLRGQRPHAIELAQVAGLELGFLTIEQSAYWTVHLSESSEAWLHDCSILSTTENGDGVDIGAQNVLLERMLIATSDDAIVLKSGDAPAGSGFPPTSNVTIRDCSLASGEGCIAIGSEMTAGVSDVLVHNVSCSAAGHALLYIKERRLGGGYVRNITVRDSSITGPVERFLWLSQHFGEGGEHAELQQGSSAEQQLPVLANITLRNIAVVGAGAVVQAALLNGDLAPPGGQGGAGSILGLVLENISLGEPLQGWACANASGTWRQVQPAPCSELTPA